MNFLSFFRRSRRGAADDQHKPKPPLSPERIRQLIAEAEREEQAQHAAALAAGLIDNEPLPPVERRHDPQNQWSLYAEPEATKPSAAFR